MADNQRSSQGNRGSSRRGFAAMGDAEQREIARKGGQASAQSQRRDEQGQFAGSAGSGSRASSGTRSTGGGRSGGGQSSGSSSTRGGNHR